MSAYEEWASNLQTLERNLKDGSGSPSPRKGPWDYIVIGGEVCPGVAQVSVKSASGLDVQKPKGGKRASIVDNGDPLLTITIKIELMPDELQEFRDFILPILRPPGKRRGRAPLEFSHPMGELWGVNTIAIQNISTPHPESGGTMKVTISAIEHADAPKPVKRTKKVKAKGSEEKEVQFRQGTTVLVDPFDPTPPTTEGQF